MWLKKIKNNSRQYILFALIVTLTISVFSMCFSFVVELGEYANNLLNDDNSSDLYLMTMHDMELKKSITDKEAFENIASYNTYEGYSITAPIEYDGQNIAMLFQSALRTDSIDDMPEFTLVESTGGEKTPQKGEIWLPMVLSDACGISLGDKIVLGYDEEIELVVSGIFKAKVLITQNLGFAPIILSDDDLTETISKKETPIRLYGLDLNDNSDDAIAKIKDSCLGMSFSVTRQQLRANFEQVANVISNMGAIAAVIIFVAALAIIRYVITNNVISEYRSIGIYKSLGYTNRQICNFYLNGYMIIGAIAAVIGCGALLPFVQKLGEICAKYADEFKITTNSLKTMWTTLGLFMLLIFINVNKALKIIKKKSAVEIIRSNANLAGKKIGKSKIKDAVSPFAMAVNSLFKHTKSAMLSVFAFMFSVHLAMIFIMIGFSAYNMSDNYNKWFAIPTNNGYVSGVLTDDVVNYLEKSDDIDSFVYGSVCTPVPVSTSSVDVSMNLFNFDVFSTTDPTVTGVNITPDFPTNDNEIAITLKAASVLGCKVGDDITLTINGKEATYKIVGTYTSMFSNFGIMMTKNAMSSVNEDYSPYMAFVTLRDGASFSQFHDDITEQFPAIAADESWFAIETAMGATQAMLVNISGILTSVFLVFTLISLSVVTSINIENKVRECGIMKSLGFTGGYIMRMNIWSSLITAVLGIAIAFVLHVALSKTILSTIMVDAFENPYGLIAIYIGFEILLTVVLTYFMNRKMSKVSPKILMED